MTDFCIQIHPDRTRDLDLAHVRSVCERLAADKGLIKRFAFVDRTGDDEDPRHVNLIFDTDRPRDLWTVLRGHLYRCPAHGRAMQMSSMAMCEGEHGWRDYLLLYHYDPREQLHSFEEHQVQITPDHRRRPRR